MKQILTQLQKIREKPAERKEEQMENQNSITKEELLAQKQRLDARIKQEEKKEIDSRIISSLRKLQDISDSVSDLQNSLNVVWKRTKQVEEELKEALTKDF